MTSCEVEFPLVGQQLRLSVFVDCERFGRLSVAAGGQAGAMGQQLENWVEDVDNGQLVLKGDVCQQVQRGVERVDVAVGCILGD